MESSVYLEYSIYLWFMFPLRKAGYFKENSLTFGFEPPPRVVYRSRSNRFGPGSLQYIDKNLLSLPFFFPPNGSQLRTTHWLPYSKLTPFLPVIFLIRCTRSKSNRITLSFPRSRSQWHIQRTLGKKKSIPSSKFSINPDEPGSRDQPNSR